jgi:GNAT superfamily N-acetyltransferase
VAPDTEVHVISNADLAAGVRPPWDDPEEIARISESKRSALLANPLIGGADEPVQLVGTLGNRVIGRMDLVAGRIETPEGPVRCFWGSAFYVPEEFRSTLIGVKLVLTMERLVEAVGAGGPSQLAYPLYKSLRYLDFPLRRYVLVRRSRSIAARYLGSGPHARAAAAVVDVTLAPYRTLLEGWGRWRTRGLRGERAREFPPELEPLLRQAAAPIAMHRSKAWFDWVLRETFFDEGHRRELYLVRDRRGQVVAYFLVKARRYETASHYDFRDMYLGSLHDWLILDREAVNLSQVIQLATRTLLRWKVDAVEVCLPRDARLDLRRWGLVPVGEMHVVVKGSPTSLLARPELQQPELWRIRPGEGDYVFS